MLRSILEDVMAKGFKVSKVIMDHDTSGGNIACSVFPEVRIQYCGNHSAKTFHRDLVKIKSIPCKVHDIKCAKDLHLQCSPRCKSRMTDAFIRRAKKALRNIACSPDVITVTHPLTAFSTALLNLHSHYCLDVHTSEWCKYPQRLVS